MATKDDPPVNPFQPHLGVYCSFIDFNLSIYKPETVKTYLKRINTAASERTGYPITRHLNKIWIKRTFVAAAKRIGYDSPNKRLPLTADILARLHPKLDLSRHNDRALWAILCVGVFSLARIGELVPALSSGLKVTLGAVSIKANRGALFLVGTKTDRMRKGVNLLFFKNNSKCCPVTAILRARQIPSFCR